MKITIEFDNGRTEVIDVADGYAAFLSVMHGDDKDNTSALVGRIDHRDLISINASLLHRTRLAVGDTMAAMILRTAEAVEAAKSKEDRGGSGNVN